MDSKDDYHLISPSSFAKAMRSHWTTTLGNAWSPAFEEVWTTMGQAFGKAIIDFDRRVTAWHVLQPPTGSGKTQGTCVYCSLAARLNEAGQRKLGILIVTRQIAEAENLVSQVNHLAKRNCAVAKHSQSKVSIAEAQNAEVLVITHAAYTKALEAKIANEEDRLASIIGWKHGRRRLTIIDESLSEIIAEYQVKAEDIRFALGFVSQDVRRNHVWGVSALEQMLSVLDQMSEAASDSDSSGEFQSSIVWRAVQENRIEVPDMGLGELRLAMAALPYDDLTLKRISTLDRERIRQRVDATLAACEAIMSMWAFYTKKGLDHTLNVSQLLIPADLPSPVVLDATASQNFLWELLGDRAYIHETKTHPRSYANVTLHVACGTGLGKTKMMKMAKGRIPKVIADLRQHLAPNRKVLFCTHKAVEHIALEYETSFAEFKVAHWGAIDGRNDWQEFDTVVLFGLSYRDAIWANNAFIALQGLPDDEWMSDPKWGTYANIRQEMQTKQLSVSMIQAINRIRCRRVIDHEGNCDKADVFVILPNGELGNAILSNIAADMPNIHIVEWDYQIDGVPARKVRKGSSHEAILAYMKNAPVGELPTSQVREEFELCRNSYKALLKTLRDQHHPLSQALAEIGVTYHSTGMGRGAKSFLLKH